MNKILVTKDGYEKLKLELEQLKSKRDTLLNRIEETSQSDEEGENPLAVQLKEELEITVSKIDELEEGILNMEIVNSSKKYTKVEVGSKVKIRLDGASEKEFYIVSHFEANPSENKISDQSPLGVALLGKKVKDDVEFQAPVGKVRYKIIAID